MVLVFDNNPTSNQQNPQSIFHILQYIYIFFYKMIYTSNNNSNQFLNSQWFSRLKLEIISVKDQQALDQQDFICKTH